MIEAPKSLSPEEKIAFYQAAKDELIVEHNMIFQRAGDTPMVRWEAARILAELRNVGARVAELREELGQGADVDGTRAQRERDTLAQFGKSAEARTAVRDFVLSRGV